MTKKHKNINKTIKYKEHRKRKSNLKNELRETNKRLKNKGRKIDNERKRNAKTIICEIHDDGSHLCVRFVHNFELKSFLPQLYLNPHRLGRMRGVYNSITPKKLFNKNAIKPKIREPPFDFFKK